MHARRSAAVRAATVGALAAGLLVLAPSTASAQEAAAAEAAAGAEDGAASLGSEDGDPARYPPSSVRWKLVAGGVGITAAAYGLGAALSAAWPEVPGAESLYIPVAGPWIMLGQSGCSPDDPGCEVIVAVRGVLLVLDGLVQAGGLAIAGEGLFMTTESDTASAPAPRPAGRSARSGVTLTPVPLVTERQTGLGVVGSF